MRSTLDVVQILFDVVKTSDLFDEVTGDVYKLQRPLASELEDVIINCLPVDDEQLQRAVANVNIYVPSVTVATPKGETQMPDTERLLELANIAKNVLRLVVVPNDYTLRVQKDGIFEDKASKSYFVNIRIDWYAYNINNNS